MFTEVTGSKQVHVRRGFADCDTYGEGYWAAATGNLDAPDFMPQGSVHLFRSMVPNPVISHAHRDWNTGHMPIGTYHAGPGSHSDAAQW